MNIWLLLLAILPGLGLLLFFYFRDRYKKEPLWPIFLAFLLGAFILLPASATSNLVQGLTGWYSRKTDLITIFLGSFFIAGLIEEGWKFFVVRLYCYHRPEFDAPYDGIMYSTAVALGFATIENILYVFSPSLLGGLRTGVLRAFLAVPSHAFYGVLMGYFLGEAKFAKTTAEENLFALIGLVLAIIAHGTYDFLVIALPHRPLLTGGLIIFSFLVWVVFFEASRRQAEKSPRPHAELTQFPQKQSTERPTDDSNPTDKQ